MFLGTLQCLPPLHTLSSLWDTESGQSIVNFVGHTGDVMSITLGPDRTSFVSGACDSSAKVGGVEGGEGRKACS